MWHLYIGMQQANSNQASEMNTKSEDDLGGIEDDPFALFNEWSGKADREACQAWSAPEPAPTTRHEASTAVGEDGSPIKQP